MIRDVTERVEQEEHPPRARGAAAALAAARVDRAPRRRDRARLQQPPARDPRLRRARPSSASSAARTRDRAGAHQGHARGRGARDAADRVSCSRSGGARCCNREVIDLREVVGRHGEVAAAAGRRRRSSSSPSLPDGAGARRSRPHPARAGDHQPRRQRPRRDARRRPAGDRGVASSDDGAEAVLAVTDNGSGMDAETARARLRAVLQHQGRRRGTGFGLATVHGIVNQSGGRIASRAGPARARRSRSSSR